MKCVLFGLAAMTLGMNLAFAEKAIQMSQLPPAVQKAIQEQTKGAEVKGLSTETEKGKTYYEAETRLNGRARDLLFDKTGALVEVEEETTMDAIPAPAKAAIEKKAAGGKVLKVETVTAGKDVKYEAEIDNKGNKSEVAVKGDGSIAK